MIPAELVVDAERHMIGLSLLHRDAWEACKELPGSMLLEPRHRQIWQGLHGVEAKGLEPDAPELVRSGALSLGKGWPIDLEELMYEGSYEPPSKAKSYRRVIEDASAERKATAILGDARADLLRGKLTPAGLAERLAAITTPGQSSSTPALPTMTIAELAMLTDLNVPWVWKGYVAKGEVTLLAGREKMGKSTFLFGLMRAIVHCGYFLEQPTMSSNILYLTEESLVTFLDKCRIFALTEHVHVLTRTTAPKGISFGELMDRVIESARRQDAKVVILDTLTHWGELPEDAENHAGAVQGLYAHLQRVAANDLAVIVVHHMAKGGREVRGSTAIASGADVVLKFLGLKGQARGRTLYATGRHIETPSGVQFMLSDDDWRYQVVAHNAEPLRDDE